MLKSPQRNIVLLVESVLNKLYISSAKMNNIKFGAIIYITYYIIFTIGNY